MLPKQLRHERKPTPSCPADNVTSSSSSFAGFQLRRKPWRGQSDDRIRWKLADLPIGRSSRRLFPYCDRIRNQLHLVFRTERLRYSVQCLYSSYLREHGSSGSHRQVESRWEESDIELRWRGNGWKLEWRSEQLVGPIFHRLFLRNFADSVCMFLPAGTTVSAKRVPSRINLSASLTTKTWTESISSKSPRRNFLRLLLCTEHTHNKIETMKLRVLL